MANSRVVFLVAKILETTRESKPFEKRQKLYSPFFEVFLLRQFRFCVTSAVK